MQTLLVVAVAVVACWLWCMMIMVGYEECRERWFLELLLANLLQATGAAKSPMWVHCEPENMPFRIVICGFWWFLPAVSTQNCLSKQAHHGLSLSFHTTEWWTISKKQDYMQLNLLQTTAWWYNGSCSSVLTEQHKTHGHTNIAVGFCCQGLYQGSVNVGALKGWQCKRGLGGCRCTEPKHDLKAGRIITMGGSLWRKSHCEEITTSGRTIGALVIHQAEFNDSQSNLQCMSFSKHVGMQTWGNRIMMDLINVQRQTDWMEAFNPSIG